MRDRMKMGIFAVVGVGIWILLFAYLNHRGYETYWKVVILALSAVSLIWHATRLKKEEGYLAKLTGVAKTGKKRVAAYDYLRLIAVGGVILTHAMQLEIEAQEMNATGGQTAIWVITMAANAIYVMLSGALHYKWKQEKILTYYLKRFSAVVIPLVVYYLWYLSANYNYMRGWGDAPVRDVLEWLGTNTMKCAPHMWLIYVILSLYITAPFFRWALRAFPHRELTVILTVLFVFSLYKPFVEQFLITDLTYGNAAILVPFSEWLLISLYGYWASLEESRRYDRITIPLGAAALIAIAVMSFMQPGADVLERWCLNGAPLPPLVCVGLFALMFRFRDRLPEGGPILRSINRYSYGIILIHWYTLNFIVIGRLHITAGMAGGLGLLFSLIVTLVISWIICFIIENLIILPLRLLISLIIV